MLGAQPRQGVGMCSYTSRAAALALLVGALACSDRPPGTAPEATGGPVVLSTATNPELLARSLALALGDPTFRASVKGELDRSPYRAPTRNPGDRGSAGRDRFFDRPGRHHLPGVRGPVSVATAPSTATRGARPVPDQSPFRGRL